MTKYIYLPIILLIFFGGQLMAQHHHDHDHDGHVHRTCGTVDHMKNLKAKNPQISQEIENTERAIQKWISQNPENNSQRAIITIPVVVHVLYKNNAHNISDAQIESQIQILNDDYRRTNSDASNTPSSFLNVAADCEIEFCLAKQDPNGNPTNGITRTQTSKSSFNINTDEAKFSSQGGKDIWNRNNYLNIWIVPAIDDNGQTGILGYAQMPGGPSSTDGVVIQHKNFGNKGTAAYPFNKGRTATHEVGHWLSLYHIWGDDGNSCYGSDNCSDTPNQADENYGCPSYPQSSCSNTSDMFMNYMDYTDDRCMNIFTKKQRDRMKAVLNTSRSALKNSPGCITVGIEENQTTSSNIRIFPNPSKGLFHIEFTLLQANENIQIRAYNSLGKEVLNQQSTLSYGGQINIDMGTLPRGIYQVVIETRKGVESRKIMIQ